MASDNNVIEPQIPKFTGKNYNHWKIQMKVLLKYQEIWEVVNMGFKEPTEDEERSYNVIQKEELKDLRKKDQKALVFIHHGVDQIIFDKIAAAETSHEAWFILEKIYDGINKVPILAASSSQLVGAMNQRLVNAAKDNNVARIKELVEEDSNILMGFTPEGNTILHLAVRFRWGSSIDEKICELCPLEILTHCNAKGQTSLHSAVQGNNLKAITMITSKVAADVEHGGHELLRQTVRTADLNGDTALHLALRDRLAGIASELIDLDGEGLSNMVNNRGESPLYLAALTGLSKIVKHLLEFSPNNIRGPPHNRTALHAAVMRDDKASARELLKVMSFLDKETDGLGFIPLHQAARSGRIEIVNLLLDHDPSTGYTRDRDGNMPIHMAARHGMIRTFQTLYTRCPDSADALNGYHENILHCAVKCMGRKIVRKISEEVRLGSLANQQDNNGNTPLHLAVLAGHFYYSFKFHLNRGVLNLSIANNDGYTTFDLYISRMPQLTSFHRDLYMEFFLTNKLWWNTDCLALENFDISFFLTEEKSARRQKYTGNVSLVATIMATMTFAAAFTMPGGYSSEDGKAVLFHNAALKVFIISDTISMCCSLLVAFLFSSRKLFENPSGFYIWYSKLCGALMKISFVGMLVAFATGMYAVLAPKCMWLGILVCTMCTVLLLITYLTDNIRKWGLRINTAFNIRLPWAPKRLGQ